MSTLVTTSYMGTPSLGTAARVQIRNGATGVVLLSRTSTGVREDVALSGFYVWEGSLADAPSYAVLWDEGGSSFLAPGAGEVIAPPVSVLAGATTVLAATAPASINPLTFTIKRGDTDPSIIAQALYPDPSNPANMIPWPIPDASIVKFTMRDSADFAARTRTAFTVTTPKVHAGATVDDALNGIMSYGWAVGDTDTDGLFRAEFEVTSGAEIRTFPVGSDDTRNWIAVTIVDDLDPGILDLTHTELLRTDGAIAYWQLDESDGTRPLSLTDSIGAFTLTTTGSAFSVVTGRNAASGNALSFTGAASNYADAGDAAAFSPQVGGSGLLSLEAWVKPANVALGANQWIIAKGNTAAFEWGLGISSAGKPQMIVWSTDASSQAYALGSTSLTNGTWYHLVGTFDAANSLTKIYVNGVLAATNTAVSSYPPGSTNTASTVRIGARQNGQPFTGVIDDVSVYNVALTASQVLGHYTA